MLRRLGDSISSILKTSPVSAESDAAGDGLDGSDDLDLLDLLLMSRDLGTSDPLDKIYALLGLAEHSISPNYESSPEAIFHEFALDIIGDVTSLMPGTTQGAKVSAKSDQAKNALILLSCAGKPNQLRDIPSYTPDWTADLTSRPLVFEHEYCAGGDIIEMDWNYETGLQLCGRLLDTVRVAGTVLLKYNGELDGAALIEQWWKEAKGIVNYGASRFPITNSSFRAMCRELKINGESCFTFSAQMKLVC